MRMIEQITQVVATKLLQLKQQRKPVEAMALVGELYKKLSMPNTDTMRKLSASHIADMTTVNGEVQTDKLAAVADLMKEQAAVCELMEDEEGSWSCSVKALQLRLLLFELEPAKIPSAAADEWLRSFPLGSLPEEVSLQAIRYYEATGQYSRAEDLLFIMLEEDLGSRHNIVQAGIHLYERLLDQDDEKLAAGKLPRAEVVQSLQQLKKAFASHG
jgi:hypothetical protein